MARASLYYDEELYKSKNSHPQKDKSYQHRNRDSEKGRSELYTSISPNIN